MSAQAHMPPQLEFNFSPIFFSLIFVLICRRFLSPAQPKWDDPVEPVAYAAAAAAFNLTVKPNLNEKKKTFWFVRLPSVYDTTMHCWIYLAQNSAYMNKLQTKKSALKNTNTGEKWWVLV